LIGNKIAKVTPLLVQPPDPSANLHDNAQTSTAIDYGNVGGNAARPTGIITPATLAEVAGIYVGLSNKVQLRHPPAPMAPVAAA